MLPFLSPTFPPSERSRTNPDFLCTSVNSFTGQNITLQNTVCATCPTLPSLPFIQISCVRPLPIQAPPPSLPDLYQLFARVQITHFTGIILAANSTLSTGIAAKTLLTVCFLKRKKKTKLKVPMSFIYNFVLSRF
uniref:Uncharacterized protein n=1 Tax=Pyxicephalus adspersus TaxID=30357 RepID=A0AAV2ZKH4_PYXAD|nr:TPA: hypothetical protein GDO54_003241 [Pyxicephalus adspersus]